ncbi:OLC1v1018890C1 [Oldenlandia corymbosa var. corymbosa]|uniref:OLC1v1018890C1 n=1 Tax=Oldenlandia corymbosa var. corymbosa TaxID=529605 RepID=A0AAV1ECV0_OLDCO|nr:OLC1v1018890C1 [Oldenlandia corymbosa var. corymbosa]
MSRGKHLKKYLMLERAIPLSGKTASFVTYTEFLALSISEQGHPKELGEVKVVMLRARRGKSTKPIVFYGSQIIHHQLSIGYQLLRQNRDRQCKSGLSPGQILRYLS